MPLSGSSYVDLADMLTTSAARQGKELVARSVEELCINWGREFSIFVHTNDLDF